ncbi:MAG: hypothetical protein WCP73_06160, partial [Eubacteriales bacterium]
METILAIKLHMPVPRADLVPRNVLIKRLDGSLGAGSRLTLVSASAGYGKTTLVYEWLSAFGSPVAWLSLDDADNEPARFFLYILSALQTSAACVSEKTMDAIKEQQLLPAEVVTSLLNDLAGIKDRLFIVLDDYHLIQSGPIHQAVQMLIDYLPPAVHMVLITRTDPPIAIPRLRARGQLTEIRIDDLRFSATEAEAFFTQTMHLQIEPGQADTLERRTEGWIAGLQLAALAIQHTPQSNMNAFIEEFGGNHKYIIDYLVEEVLNHLPAEICSFLTATSLLDRFCPALGNAVVEIQNSGDMILELEKSNLFLVSLDDKRLWFRYHHLFADSLASRLSVSQKNAICLKASEWFHRNGYPRDAVEYAFRSGNQDQAFRMVENAKTHLFETGPLTVLVKWLERLPDERILQSENLSVNKAVAYLLTGEFQKYSDYMKKLDDTFFSNASDENKARILYLRAQMAETADPPAALRMARQGLSIMSGGDVILKAATMNIAANILFNEGTAEKAIIASRDAYEFGLTYDNSFNTISSLVQYANSLDLALRRRDALLCLHDYLNNEIQTSIAPPS